MPSRRPTAPTRSARIARATTLCVALCSALALADDQQPTVTTAAGTAPVVPSLGAAAVFKDDQILATVNGRPIPAMSLENVVRQLEEGVQDSDRQSILEELINMEVLAQAAENDGLDRKPEVASALLLQYTQTLANAFLAERNAELAITETELRAEYDRQVANLPDAEYRTSHILVEDESTATTVIESLAAGEGFEALADKFSVDSNGAGGGVLGWLGEGAMLPEMAAAVKALQPGQTSVAPVQSQYGWHIIRLEDTRQAAKPDFDAIKPGLEGLLVRRSLAERVAELRNAADVEIR